MDNSADNYGYLPISNPFDNKIGANCNINIKCPPGYTCISNICTPSNAIVPSSNSPPDIPFIITGKFMYLNKIIDIPIVKTTIKKGKTPSVSNLNQACVFDSDCYPSLWCSNDPNGTGTICLNSGTGSIGTACVSMADCSVGLDCYPGYSTPGSTGTSKSCQMGPILPSQIILPAQPAGGICNFYSDCDQTVQTDCINGFCSPVSSPVPVINNVPIGGSCSLASDCSQTPSPAICLNNFCNLAGTGSNSS